MYININVKIFSVYKTVQWQQIICVKQHKSLLRGHSWMHWRTLQFLDHSFICSFVAYAV